MREGDERTFEALLKRDRAVLLVGVVGVAALAWAYVLRLALRMEMGAMEAAMPLGQPWGRLDLILLFVMWAVMMVAMMVPSAAPLILLYGKLSRDRQEQSGPFAPTATLLSGYLLVWFGFSALAALVQWTLHGAALLSPAMVIARPLWGGALLLAAGLFQWTPLKQACLSRCRLPLGFLITGWRGGTTGTGGALLMGLRHGGYCVGCCWALIVLLFVVGVMNLLWVAIIAAFIMAERGLPGGVVLGRVVGGALVGAGLVLLLRGWS